MYAVLATGTVGLFGIYDEASNTLVSRYDRAILTYYEPDGTPREPSPEEEAAVLAGGIHMVEMDNFRILSQGVMDNVAILKGVIGALNAITALTNAEINSNPAAVIKNLAREVKTCARQTVRIAKVVASDLADLDLGAA